MKLDDSVFEYALYDVLAHLEMVPGTTVQIDELRGLWRSTALRHSDLHPALEMLVQSGSLVASESGQYWTLTQAGCERAAEIGDVAPATMGDQVARSVLKTIRDAVNPEALQPRTTSLRRRSTEARDRARERLQHRVG